MSDHLTTEQRAALDAARELARAGVPVFVARPDATSSTGFALPQRWEQTAPDPAVVDQWAPGMALCAVMGCGVDLIDVDPRNAPDGGGSVLAALDGMIPRSYGAATTPSGGFHSFVRSIGTGSRDNVAPGVDVKGGLPDGTGRGFAFLAPTVKTSKVTGEPTPYRWVNTPDVAALSASLRDPALDSTGAALAARVHELKAGSAAVRKPASGPDWYRAFLANREPQSAPAAEKAIADKLAEVAGWRADSGVGFRTALMRAAVTLGGYVGGGWLDESSAWSKLEGACSQVWGAPDEDDRRWIAQGITDGADQPFHVYTADDEATFGEAAQAVAAQRTGPPWSPYRALGVEPFDPAWCGHDQEFAEAVAGRTLPVLRYAADAGSWVVREAQTWREREDLSGWAVAIVARLMPLGQSPVPKDHADRTEAHWQAVRRARFMASGQSSGIERKLKSILRGGDHPASIELGRLDGDPEVLWAGGLPFDLRASGDVPTLAAVDPATPHMRTCSVAPELRETPRWDAFVEAVLPDPDVRAWAMRVLAVALTGYPDAVLPVLYGPERTGKTALVTLLVDVLGSYGHAADPRLLAGADNAHASIVYALKGRRLSFVDEGPRRGHLAAERLKQLTGGGQLTGNAMRSNPVTFSPTHTLVMTTNDEPPITDPALRARVRIIPCDADPAAVRARRQALTPAAWELEAPGVLAAMMRQAAAWLAAPDSAGLDAGPEIVRTQTVEIAHGQDPVREWVELCTVPAEPGTAGRELYRRFVAWHETQAHYRRMTAPTESSFGRSLTAMGFPWSWGGERGKLKYRPLSVMDGGPGMPPNLPTFGGGVVHSPQPGPAPTGVVADGMPTVADGWSSGVSATENPSSECVSSGVADSADTTSRSIANEDENYSIRATPVEASGGNRGEPATCRQPSAETVDLRSSGRVAETSADGSATSGGVSDSPDSPVDNPVSAGQYTSSGDVPPWLVGRDLSLKVSVDEAAARAERDGTTKAQARKALGAELKTARAAAKVAEREAERLAAIATAAGELVGFPSVVDRAGHVLDVSVEQAVAVVHAAIARSGALTVDVETSGYPVGHWAHVLRTVQLGDDTACAIFDPSDREQAAAVAELMADRPGPDGRPVALHAHSATADLVPLAHAGLVEPVQAWARMHDTVLPAKLADPQSTGSDPGLKQLAPAVLGPRAVVPGADAGRRAVWAAGKWSSPKQFADQLAQPVERNGWAQVDSRCVTMQRYAGSDVLDTAALARELPAPAPHVLDRERLAQRMTARVAHRGVRIDGEHVATLTEQHEQGRADAAVRVRGFGVDNPGSDMQVADVALRLGAHLPRTATGRASVKAAALEPLRTAPGELGAFVSAVLDHRHHDTVLGLFLKPYALLVEHGDGRARPTVYTVGTDTGRMSCVRPNLQQLPRSGGVRACITADPGHVLVSADFSGVEIRVAAALSQDPTLLGLIADGRDLHGEIARLVWGETAGKAERYIAKRIVFGRLYGGGLATLAEQAGTDEATVQRALDALDSITPQLTGWSAAVRDAVKRGHTQFASYSGRVIHLTRDTPHKAPNYCVTPDTPILRSDLRHVPAAEIRVGDRLVAFDEYPVNGVGGQNKYHHLRTAVVEATSTVRKPSVTVRTADGKATTCSADHLWLVRPLKGRKDNRPRVRWVRADALQPGDDLLSLGTWEEATSRVAGYLAGLYDGEGSLTRHAGGRRKNQLHFSQVRGPVMDAMCAGMAELGLPYSYYDRAPNSTSPTDSVVVSGLRNVMRTLGTLQPKRFAPRFEALYEGNAITAGLTESVAVTAIDDAGEIELTSIQTSTRTLVANGYLSHNCIQGSARELLVDALGRWQNTPWGDSTLLPVHDELVVAVPEADADAATAALVDCMAGELHGVPIVAEASAPSFAWADST